MTLRKSAVRRRSGAVTAAVMTALLVAACGGGGDENTDEQAATSKPSSTSVRTTEHAAETTEAAPSTPDDVILDDTVRYESGVMVKDCDPDTSPGLGEDNFQAERPSIFDPKTGEFHQVPQTPVPTGKTLESARCLATGTSDNPSVTIALNLRTPASGLDPEVYSTDLVTYTLNDDAEPQRFELGSGSSGLWFRYLVGTGGNILWAEDSSPDKPVAARLISPDGRISEIYNKGDFDAVGYVDDGMFALVKGDEYSFRDGATGGELDYIPDDARTREPSEGLQHVSNGGSVYSYKTDDVCAYNTACEHVVYLDPARKKSFALGKYAYVDNVQVFGD